MVAAAVGAGLWYRIGSAAVFDVRCAKQVVALVANKCCLSSKHNSLLFLQNYDIYYAKMQHSRNKNVIIFEKILSG